jgi:hypothetical protein
VDPVAEAVSARGLEVVRRLGSGSHGDVFEVQDGSTGERLALKVLRHVERGWIVGFKREFRFLVDVRHPNLVGYHGLWTDGGAWYLLMDLVDGRELSTIMVERNSGPVGTTASPGTTDEASTLEFPEGRSDDVSGRGLPPVSSLYPAVDFAGADRTGDGEPVAGAGLPEWPPRELPSGELPSGELPSGELPGGEAATFELDSGQLAPIENPDLHSDLEASLRIARGLARALRALHASGKLHRDLKPSNVMLRHDGAPVLLDFGLVTATHDKGRLVMGTPRYMAPECLEPPVGPPADWYAFGLILFELLVGRPPVEGSGLSLVRRRKALPAPPPQRWNPALSDDLNSLIMGLLDPDPSRRPTGEEVCARLGVEDEATDLRSGPFVGRAAELAQLDAAAAAALDGCVSLVRLCAPTGMGKSALIQAFRERLGPGALPLFSRCHSHESLPYKALDGAMDALSLALLELGTVSVRSGAVDSLLQAFPALAGRIQVSARSGRVSLEAALVELWAAVGRYRTPLLVIDDAQWGDADSARLVARLVRGGGPMMVLVAHRDGEQGPFLDELESLLALATTIELAPLALADARALAEGLGGREVDTVQISSCLDQSRGHPYLLAELLRGGGHQDELSSLIRSRLDRLDPAGRRLVELVVVSPGALPEGLLREAAGDAAGRFRELLAECRSQRLLRTGTADRELSLLAWHDRVREVCVDTLDASESRSLHQTLGEVWSAREAADPEVLAVHWEGAGQLDQALVSLRQARERAEHARAFGHAAVLGRRILRLPGAGEADRRALVEALVHSGQRRAAAQELVALAQDAPADQARRDRRRAAEHLLRSGEFGRGIALFQDLADEAGMPLGGPRWLVLLRVVRARLRVWWRAYRPSIPQGEPPVELVERAELGGALNRGLRFVATLDGVVPSTVWLLDSLDIGDPARLLVPMANEVNTLAAGGPKGASASLALFDQVVGMMQRVDDVEAKATTWLELAGAACLLGDFPEALLRIERAEALMAAAGGDLARHIDLRFAYFATACWYVGRWEELVDQTSRAIRDADARDDRWTALWLRGAWVPAAQVLVGGSLADARSKLSQVVEAAGTVAPVLASSAVVTALQLDLLEGRPREALARLEAAWPGLKSSFLLEAQLMRGGLEEARARAGVMLVAKSGGAEGRAAAELAIRRLDDEGMPWMTATARVAEAGLAACSGAPQRAAALLAEARVLFEGCGFDAHVQAIDASREPPPARRQLGAVDLRLRHQLLLPGLPLPPWL